MINMSDTFIHFKAVINGNSIMTDRGLKTFIKVLFGIGGIVIVSITWIQIGTLSDRILSTFIGLIGISVAVSAVRPFKYISNKIVGIRNLPQYWKK